MANSRFVYVTQIRTTPEKLWQALIDPEFTRRYWCDTRQESEWKPGSSWRIIIPDGRVADSGENERIEIVPWPLADLDGAIAACEDAKTLIALLWLSRRLTV